MAKPPWCAVPTRGVGGIVNSKLFHTQHTVKSNPEFRAGFLKAISFGRNRGVSANHATTDAERR